jgi:hypothetical protein
MAQKMPKPNDSLLPKSVSIISPEDVRHNKPIKNSTKAMKNV